MLLEVVEGLNESFIRSTEKGRKGRKREHEGENEQQEAGEKEEFVQRGTPLIFFFSGPSAAGGGRSLGAQGSRAERRAFGLV